MKRVLIATTYAVLLSASFSMKALADNTTPNEIFNLARNGYFREEGIPSHSGLIIAYRFGDVTAQDLINAAIEQNRLSPETLEDEGFIRALDQYLVDNARGE
jgi:hypothetical protein